MKLFKKMLVTVMILSMVMSTAVFTPAYAYEKADGWSVSVHNCDGGGGIDYDNSYAGDGSLFFYNNSGYGSNKYVEVNTTLQLKHGVSYRIVFYGKSVDNNNLSMMFDWNYATKTNLLAMGKNYDWTRIQFDYIHQNASGPVVFKFIMEDKGKYWVDNFEMYEIADGAKVGENIATYRFDTYNIDQKDYVPYDRTNQDAFAAVKGENSMDISAISQFATAYKSIPVLYSHNEKAIDADNGDWAEAVPMKLPVSKNQYYDVNNLNGYDLKADVKYAWDEENLYMLFEIEDDVHSFVENASYWNGDSIQLVIGKHDEPYGEQFGYIYDDVNGAAHAYSTFNFDAAGVKVNEFTELTREQTQIACKRENGITTYEIALPWEICYGETPESFLMSFILNDNDGEGREYGLEIAPGIGIGKNSNEQFPTIRLIDKDAQFYTWVDSKKSVDIGVKQPFDVYIASVSSNDTVTAKLGNETKSVKLTPGKTEKVTFDIVINDMATHDFAFEVVSETENSNETIAVKGTPSKAGIDAYCKKLNADLKTLNKLLKKCEKEGIPTDYETMAYTILERWANVYLPDEAKNNWYVATEYNTGVLDDMYLEAKESLEAYLAGTKEPFNVPKYVTSTATIDDYNVTAETVDSYGNKETRPVHFIGYGHFEDAVADIPNWKDFGNNTIQNEIGPNSIISSYPGWDWYCAVGADATLTIEDGSGVDGTKALKVVKTAPAAPNKFSNIHQPITVEPNTDYIMSFDVKAENANGLQASWNDGVSRLPMEQGTYDWKHYEFEFNSGDRTSARVWFLIEDLTDAVYYDNIKVVEKGVENAPNLVANGEIEEGYLDEQGDYYIWPQGAKRVVDFLADAEKHDVAVSLLISPHYFPGLMYNKYPDIRAQFGEGADTSWSGYIQTHEQAFRVLNDYLDALLPQVKDFTSLNDICLTNEPSLTVWSFGDYYIPQWQEWLKEKYNNDLAAVNAVHRRNYTSFDSIMWPTESRGRDLLGAGGSSDDFAIYDLIKFSTDVHVEFHQFLAKKVKEYMPDLPVQAKAQGTLGIHGGFPINLCASQSMEEFYVFEDIAGCDYSIEWLGLTNGSHEWLGESLWYDYIAGVNEKPVGNSEDHIHVDGEENYHEGQALWYDTNLWQGAIHHRRYSQIWSWRRMYNWGVYYGSPNMRPDCVYATSKATMDLNRLSYEVQALIDEPEDIAVLYSEVSRHCNPDHMGATYDLYEAALFNGKKVRVVTETMIDKINKCKYLMMGGARNVKPSTLEAIQKFVENGGKLIMFGDGNLTKDDLNFAYNNGVSKKLYELASIVIPFESDSANIITPTQPELWKTMENFFKAENAQNVWLIDAKTGERVESTEWTTAEYNGNLLVNACHYSFTDSKQVKLVVDGKPVSGAKELRSGKILGETFTLDGCTPLLIQVGEDAHPFEDVKNHWAESHIANLYINNMINGTSATMFEPEGNVTRAEFAKMIVNATGLETKTYDGAIADVAKGSWYADFVQTAKDNGLLKNILTESGFEPEKAITREEMCAMLVSAWELKNKTVASDAEARFADADASADWAKAYINKAYNTGLMTGNEKGSFLPKATSTRAEAATVINRYIGE